MRISTSRGFTLIELLVVIAIIAALSSVILAALTAARDKGRIAAAKQEMLQVGKAVEAARLGSGNLYLGDITGSLWTCGSVSGCLPAALKTSLGKIVLAAGTFDGLDSISRDPWGNVYYLDENETTTVCNRDSLTAVGHVVYKFEYGSDYCKANPIGVAGFQ